MPNPANPQAFNRYSYVYNSPLNYVDPSGHDPWWLPQDSQGDYWNNSWLVQSNNGGSDAPKISGRSANIELALEGGGGVARTPSINDILPSPEAMCGYVIEDYICSMDYSTLVNSGNPYSISSMVASGLNELQKHSIGLRVDASLWFFGIGVDINFDVMYFMHTNDWGIFITPGTQSGVGGGGNITGGLLWGNNMYGSDSYRANSASIVGVDTPIMILPINIELDYSISSPNFNGTIPETYYLGIGKVTAEAGVTSGAGYTLDVKRIFNNIWKQ